MTLDEYERYFIETRAKQRTKKKMVKFIAGLMIGQVIGVMALALVSINRSNDGR